MPDDANMTDIGYFGELSNEQRRRARLTLAIIADRHGARGDLLMVLEMLDVKE